MDIAFALYPGMTALDFIGPHETLAHHPDATCHYLAARPGPVTCDTGLQITATDGFDAVPRPDVIVVPGSGIWTQVLESETELVAWLTAAHPTATWTTSVCTGSTLLAKAGILAGRRATTHWAARTDLAALGAEVVHDRVVVVEDVITAAGVSAGIDMGLSLAGLLWGEATARSTQLLLEYAPQPPFDSGSLETADPKVVEGVLALVARS